MNHDPSYFEDEVREGFFIPSMIKRSWAVQMDVLDIVRQICEKHDIKWFADYGTLIGCVRHGGFIPWDDDLDIVMLRDDYEKFSEIANRELPEGYKFMDIENETGYSNFLGRVVNSTRINLSPEFLDNNSGFPFSAGIDIFVLDYLYSDEEREEERRLRAKELFDFAERVKSDSRISKGEIYATVRKIAGFELDKSVPVDVALLRAITGIYKECRERDGEFVAPMYFWTRYKKQKYPISYFETPIQMRFEDSVINLPLAYTEKMRIAYNHWEIVNRKGGIHDYPCFTDQEEILRKHLGGKLPYKYVFNPADLEEEIAVKSNTDKCLDYLKIVEKAIGLSGKMLSMGNVNEALELMNNCQDLAIRAGSLIEFCNGLGTEAVAKLETFCEGIYQLYEMVTGETTEVKSEDFGELSAIIADVIKVIEHVPLNRTVLFIPFKHCYFKRMEGLYNLYLNEPGTKVMVMPVPYYYKQFDGTLKEEKFDGDLYDESLPLINYSEVDFDNFSVDEIVFENPYDEWNASITVHPFFYSSNLKKLASKLTYIPYITVDEGEFTDVKTVANMSLFIITSGVMRADRIILDSPKLKDRYLDILADKCGDYTRSIFEKKIQIWADLSESAGTEESRLSPEDREPLKDKKKLLFYTGFSDLFINGAKEIDKLSRVIDVFEKNGENIEVIWKQDDFYLDNIKKVFPQYEETFRNLMTRFEKLRIGSIELPQMKEDEMAGISAYYGSKGYYFNLAVRNRIPIMLMNCDV